MAKTATEMKASGQQLKRMKKKVTVPPYPLQVFYQIFLTFILIPLQIDERAPSPDPIVVLSTQENLGPSEEADAEFARELAKMATDSSNESRKVDKKTAMALWDSAVLPPGARKKRGADGEGDGEVDSSDADAKTIMSFTLLTKRGNKQQVRTIPFFRKGFIYIFFRLASWQCQLSPPWQYTLDQRNFKIRKNNSI